MEQQNLDFVCERTDERYKRMVRAWVRKAGETAKGVKLSRIAAGVLRELLELWGRFGRLDVFNKHSELAEKARMSVSSVQRGLKELEALKLVDWRQRTVGWRNAGRRKLSNLYTMGRGLFYCSVRVTDQKPETLKKEKSWRLNELFDVASEAIVPSARLLNSRLVSGGSERR